MNEIETPLPTSPYKDHDLLIRLDSKVEYLVKAMRELTDQTKEKVTALESRIEAIEKVHYEVDPVNTKHEVDDLQRWKRDFTLTWKVVVMIAAGTGGIVGFILSTANDILAIIAKKGG